MERRFDLIDWRAIRAIAFIQSHGAKKHGPDTWQEVPMEKHLDAAFSHLAHWASGDKIDADTGQSHLWNALTRVHYLVSQEMAQDTLSNRLKSLRTNEPHE